MIESTTRSTVAAANRVCKSCRGTRHEGGKWSGPPCPDCQPSDTDQTARLPTAAPRPRIDLAGGDLHRKVDEAWAALVSVNDPEEPRVLVRGNELVRMTERGELEPYHVDSLRDELSRVADFGKTKSDGGWTSKDPPRDVASTLLARDSGEYANAPRVDQVVDVPVLAGDGTLVTRPGHDARSRLYHRPAPGLEHVAAPRAVESVDEVEEARDLLAEELLGDFAFADTASKANALGLLLLPFVREFIDGPTPMHVILAPEPGSGKRSCSPNRPRLAARIDPRPAGQGRRRPRGRHGRAR